MAFTYSKLAEVTVGSGGTSAIDFTNIPQNYTDLLIKFSLRITTSGYDANPWIIGRLRFNGNYFPTSSRQLFGTGSATGSDTNSEPIFMEDTNGTTSVFSSGDIYIPNYTSSNNKSASVDVVGENNATASLAVLWAGLYTLVTPISSISIYKESYTIDQHSTATLYGVKAEV
jgi:hypothetical protein